MNSTCSNCSLNVDRTCRAMPLNENPTSPRLVGRWPNIDPKGWCSWHKFSLWKFLFGDGTSRT